MKKAVVARVVVLSAAVISLVVYSVRHEAERNPRGAIRGSGTIEATEIDVASEAVGRIVELKVDEGDQVQRGQVVAVLKRDALEADLQRAQAASVSAKNRLVDLENGSRPEELRAKAAQLREALAGLDAARLAARTAREAWLRPTELTANVDSARSRLTASEAASRSARAQQLEAQHGPRREEIAQARAALATAEQAVAAAEAGAQQASEALTGSRSELPPVQRATTERAAANTQVASAENHVASATAALEQAVARRDQVYNTARPDQRTQARRRIDNQSAALVQAQADLVRDEKLYQSGAIAKRQLDASLARRDQLQAALSEAQAALADLDAGARQPEKREADAAVTRAKADLKSAQDELANAKHEQAILVAAAQQQLERAGSAVPQAVARRDQATATLEQARRQRDQAAAGLDLILAGTRSERLAQAAEGVGQAVAGQVGAADAVRHARQLKADRFALRAQLEQAGGQLRQATARVDAAKANLDLAVAGNTPAKIGAARGELGQADASAAFARSKLDDTVIRAPQAGTITEIILREGETVTAGSAVVRMLDLDHLWLRIYLPVRHFGRVVRGQGATVTADAYPRKHYPGRVLTVSDNAEFTPKNTQTVEERVKQVFWVKIDVGKGLGELKPGLPADVLLDTGGAR